MISEARKKAVKNFNRRLKKATALEKETLLAFVQQAGMTSGGNLSTKSPVSTQTIKSFTRAKKYELPKKLKKYETPVVKRKKLTPREKLELEQRFRERHNLQYTSTYQQAERLSQNPLATDKQLLMYAKHTKKGSEDFEKLELESLINKLRYFAYSESEKADSQEMIDMLDEGIRNIDKDTLKNKLNEIYKRNKQIVDDYSSDLDLGGVSIISLARD